MMNFVLPASIKILESKLKVKSNSIIPSFDGVDMGCNDDGNLDIDAKYKTQTTEGDFLLFVGVINEPDSGTLAYATFCAQGKKKNNNNFKIQQQIDHWLDLQCLMRQNCIMTMETINLMWPHLSMRFYMQYISIQHYLKFSQKTKLEKHLCLMMKMGQHFSEEILLWSKSKIILIV